MAFVTEVLPWLNDPLAERTRIMIEAQEGEEALQARAREEEARNKEGAAAPPDDLSGLEGLELYEPPEP